MPISTSAERDEEAFRNSVIKLRTERNWSQNHFAQLLQEAGLTEYRQATVARLENGQRTLKLGEARIIAEIFETSVDEMINSPLIDYIKLVASVNQTNWRINQRLASSLIQYLEHKQRLTYYTEDHPFLDRVDKASEGESKRTKLELKSQLSLARKYRNASLAKVIKFSLLDYLNRYSQREDQETNDQFKSWIIETLHFDKQELSEIIDTALEPAPEEPEE